MHDMVLNKYSIGVKVGARRQGEGGHSGSAALMVVRRRVMFDRRGCGRGEAGLSLEGLGRVLEVLVRGRTTALWRRTGADLALIRGHPLCFWILPDWR